MKTAKEILQQYSDENNGALLVVDKWKESLLIEAMESYASQSVEAERKRIHDEVDKMLKEQVAWLRDAKEILDCINPPKSDEG